MWCIYFEENLKLVRVTSDNFFLQVYLEDSLGERVWVDRSDCKMFVENILTAFMTKIPPSSMLQAEPLKSEQPASASKNTSKCETLRDLVITWNQRKSLDFIRCAGTSPNPHHGGTDDDDKHLMSLEQFGKSMQDEDYAAIAEKRCESMFGFSAFENSRVAPGLLLACVCLCCLVLSDVINY